MRGRDACWGAPRVGAVRAIVGEDGAGGRIVLDEATSGSSEHEAAILDIG
jgi:hypothetical protein